MSYFCSYTVIIRSQDHYYEIMANRADNLKDISEMIGLDLAYHLATRAPQYGRQRWVYIPQVVTSNSSHWTAKAIGHEAAATLSRYMGGCFLTVGKPERFAQRHRLNTGKTSHFLHEQLVFSFINQTV